MIKLTNISKAFKNNILLDDVTFSIESNKKTLIKGVNGSGKSVLLKLIVGYSSPDEGEIVIDNFTLHKDGDFIPNAGVSINAPEFVKNLTGLENLLELATVRKVATEEDIRNLANKLGLEKDLKKKYKTYSLGMKQKMRIIQALMDKPKYLILDEPFDALDQSSCKIVADMLDDFIKQSGNTLVFTTHSTEFEKFADDIYILNNKKVVEVQKQN